ncbi:LysM peptidoglycan-binding domain-containing protein [Kitasatospora sp. NPDC002965]|uniref:LysM peptidoglycan-binding domain-containing protein n=1 Tax=Kitasatospora sp. NPDC002965 TaxID=3154775 RepID=UPI0033AFE20A
MPRRTVSRITAALRGLLSLAALLALLGAVPYLLWHTGTLPHQIPSWADVTTALTSPDSGGLFIGALTILGWLGWLSFVGSTLVEVGALLRHRRAPRVRALGATQRLAASLVAGVALLLPTSAAFAAAPAASAAPLAATAPQHATGQSSASPTTAPDAWTGPVHQVVAGDTLWDLAESNLGDGTRWHEIAALNPQVDERGMLQPGWTLRLPGEAVERTAPPGPSGTASGLRTVNVQQGETLSAIAQRELGDADRYPELVEATSSVEQPGGGHLQNADHIEAGWQIIIPAPTGSAGPTVPESEPGQSPTASPFPTAPATVESPQNVPSTAPPAPDEPPTSNPATRTPSAQPDSPAPQLSTPAPAPAGVPAAPAETSQTLPEQSHAAVSVEVASGIGALLGAGLLSVIAWRRREQQNARRTGETIALPESTSPAEQMLDRTASPASVELLDLALRTLAARSPNSLPVVHGAKVSADRVEILVDDPSQEALSPFTDRPDGWWGVRGSRADLLADEQVQDIPAPYPGLSTIGATTDGTHVLVNLPQAGVLLLKGSEQQVREVARGIAMEAGTSAWGGHVEVRTCGFGLELQQLLPACRVMYTPSLTDATTDLARVLIEAHQAVNEGGEQPLPWMVISSITASHEELYAFADLVAKARGHRIAVILPAEGAADFFPDAQILDASVAEPQLLEPLGVQVALQRVTDEAYRQLTAAIALTTEPARPAEGAWAQLPDPDQAHAGGVPTPASSHLSVVKDREEGPDAPEGALPAAPAELGSDQEAEIAPVDVPSTADGPTTGQTAAPARARAHVVREPVPDDEQVGSPEVQVLGPLQVVGIGNSVVPPKLVLLAAYLMFRNERDQSSIGNAMNAVTPWAPKMVNEEVSRLRSRLGLDAKGEPHVRHKPRGVAMFSLSPEITSDWANFMHLAERGIPKGAAGVLDLEAAMSLVRGKPFAGAAEHSWAAPLAQTMISRIVDTAERIAELRAGDEVLDVDAARAAIGTGLSVEPTAEKLYRAWMRTEYRAGHPSAVRDVIARVHKMEADWRLAGLQAETHTLIRRLTAVRETTSGVVGSTFR